MSKRCRFRPHRWEAHRYNWYAEPRALREEACSRCLARRTQVLSNFVDYVECPGAVHYKWVTIGDRWFEHFPAPRYT